MSRIRILLFLLCAICASAQQRKLLVVSIDGLDHRYLRDADRLDLRIPTLRRLMRQGVVADGVQGIVPTVTWPSHTTIITGVPAARHGIMTNDQPGKPGQRWWFTHYLKARTLWQAAREKKMKTAAVFWPVMVGAEIDFNIPEFWIERTGHATALAPIEKHSTPGLIDRISRADPSFPVSAFSDRNILIATKYLLEQERPDLMLVHIADLDGEQHETGAFSRHVKAALEYQDQLLGWTLQALSAQTVLAIVSDHGFETNEKLFRPKVSLAQAALPGEVAVREGLVGATSARAAAHFRGMLGGPFWLARSAWKRFGGWRRSLGRGWQRSRLHATLFRARRARGPCSARATTTACMGCGLRGVTTAHRLCCGGLASRRSGFRRSRCSIWGRRSRKFLGWSWQKLRDTPSGRNCI